jgi:hypothetical protein
MAQTESGSNCFRFFFHLRTVQEVNSIVMTINDFMQACKSILVTFKNSGMSDKDFGNI